MARANNTPSACGEQVRFSFPDWLLVPDPASRLQPEDVDEPGEVIDPAHYRWSDCNWQGGTWSEAILSVFDNPLEISLHQNG